MTKQIRITVTAPEDCTDEQFNEWVKFCVGYIGGISIENPLHDHSMECSDIDID